MAAKNQRTITELLADIFPILDGMNRDHFDQLRELGFRLLPMSGQFLRCVDQPELVSKIRKAIPSDAVVITLDGQIVRVHPGIQGYGSDTFAICFGSKEWPVVPEGTLIPQLEMLIFGERPDLDRDILHRITVPVLDPSASYELRISKRAHRVDFIRELETEDQVILRVSKREP